MHSFRLRIPLFFALSLASLCSGAPNVESFFGELQGSVQDVGRQIGSANSNFASDLERWAKAIERGVEEQCMGLVNRDESIIRLHNWAGNFNFSTLNIQYPRTVAQVQHIVKNSRKLRVIGSRHSFSKIADSSHTLLSTLGLNSILSINTSVPSVTVQAGIPYNEFASTINSAGYALENLAALDTISVGGAISTAVHGSGLHNGNLATQVRSLKMVLADGSLATFGPNDPRLKAVAVGLGAFGVITEVELNVVPSYSLITYVFANMASDAFYQNFETILNLGYSVHLTSSLANSSNWDTVVVRVKIGNDSNNVANMTELFGAPLASSTASNACSSSHFWYEELLIFQAARDGTDLQTEYFVPFSRAVEAIRAVRALQAQIVPFLFIFVIRTIKSDDHWLSMQFKNNGTEGDSHVAIHFSWNPAEIKAIAKLLPSVDKALAPFGARPHWAKFFVTKPKQFLPTYPKLKDFKKLANSMDPTGKFRNKFLEENVFA